MRKKLLIVLLALSAIAVSCSEVEKGQVILTVVSINPASDPFGDTLSKDGTIPSDAVDIQLSSDLKNPVGLESTAYANIRLESVTVSFIRIDGGSDKPETFRTKVAYEIPAGGVIDIESFTIVPATMKSKFPISDLIFYGFERSTNFISIKCDVLLEFEGHTVEGDRVYARGSTTIEFTNWAD